MVENTSYNDGGFVMALAGNKCDMPPDSHKISNALSQDIAKKYGMIFNEVSAKTGQGLPEMFRKIAERVHKIGTSDS